jgi:tRNA threonylcarbamoyladenosine biosynthesis protein TsaE
LRISEVPSPTFNITNEYQIKKTLIKHYDLYRIKNENELYNLGIQENLKKQITLVEWPELLKKLKIKNSISLIFKYNKNYTERYLTIISTNKKIMNEFK